MEGGIVLRRYNPGYQPGEMGMKLDIPLPSEVLAEYLGGLKLIDAAAKMGLARMNCPA